MPLEQQIDILCPDKASRLLVTSRVHNIPRSARYVHKLTGLDMDQSWELFLKAAFIENKEGRCPPELEDIGRRIVRKCNGLPLAISVVGGLLLEHGQSVSKWERVLKGIKSHLESGEDGVSPILELSYQDLNPRLKSCFIYLSFFKEDADIMTKTLIELWIAEGIVPQTNGEETMEEIAKGFLDELINRNMVQAIKWFGDSQVVLCRMHDLLRDLSITRAKEEINFDFLCNENTSHESLDKARHLAVRCNNVRLMSLWTPNPHIRSLFFWESIRGNDFIPRRCLKKIGGCLRVLEMGGLDMTRLPKRIGSLIGLKYLGLRNNRIIKLPRSLGNLNNLQTLDISENEFVKVPNVIWKLDSLRYFYMSINMICDEPLKLDTLKNVQILTNVLLKNIVVEHLAHLVNLRELDLHLGRRQTTDVHVNMLVTLLAKLENLVGMSLTWYDMTLSLHEIVNLQHLKLLSFYGKIAKLPQCFPQNFSYLNLCSTNVSEDSMEILGKLSNLLHLKLDRDSYVGEEMVIVKDGFPRLKVLIIQHIWKLRKMHIETGGLLELKQLGIIHCNNLEIISNEEEKRMMGNLQILMIYGENKIASKLKGDEYSHIISSIPSVEIL